ncbi:MAG: LPS export ABC transporter periplasmic protein LptC, partial [OM182 bacterium]|nr:LPS export ABC transporter periplasmic protein LptC [OM182 bacterium]
MNRPRILALLIPSLTAVGLYLTLDWADDRATATSERAAMSDSLQAGQTPESRARGPIQAYSQELQTTIFDTDGALQYTLHADSQTQFEDQTSLLTQPRITLFDAGKPNWNIT